MKYFLVPLLFIFCNHFAFSQNWQLLGEDEIGDCQEAGFADLSNVYYAADESQNSLWFLFVFDITNSNIAGDFGLALGVDTNLVIDDGMVWGGPNQSMKTDVKYAFTRNGVFQTEIVNANTNPVDAVIYESETHDTLIFRFPLSAFDDDGRFNCIAATWRWGTPIDGYCEEIPNDGFLSVDISTPVFEPDNVIVEINIFPNPSAGTVWVEAKDLDIGKLTLFDQRGHTIAVADGNYLEFPDLGNGIYFIAVEVHQFPNPT